MGDGVSKIPIGKSGLVPRKKIPIKQRIESGSKVVISPRT